MISLGVRVSNVNNTITLWPEQISGLGSDTQITNEKGHIRCVSVPKLVPFFPPASQANGTAIIICPGGGYTLIDWIEHVERLAACFNPKGIAVIGLQYRTTPPSQNMPEDAVSDFRRSLDIVIANAKKWQIAPDRVVGLGFSAGANLLLRYACTEDAAPDKDELHRGTLSLAHMALVCLWPHNRPADAYSIRSNAPNAFLCASEEDETAPADFSQAIGEKLRKAGGDVRIKVYPKGHHLAFNFKESGPDIDWIPEFLAWLNDRGLLR